MIRRTGITGVLFSIVFTALFLIGGVLVSRADRASAVTGNCNVYVELIGEGNVNGTVCSPIEPYYFTMNIRKGPNCADITPAFQRDYAVDTIVTDMFYGKIDELNNIFTMIPQGLKVTVAQEIHVGDTTGHFKISGTPYTGSTQWLQCNSTEASFCGTAYQNNQSYRKTVEKSYGIKFNITRNAWTNGGKGSVSPSTLVIPGSSGSPISSKELTITISYGNFITNLSAGTDVTSWFTHRNYVWDYSGKLGDVGLYAYGNIPAGLKVTLKNAVKVGDRTCTFVFSGTPTCGSKNFISVKPADGIVSCSGSAKSECGYDSYNWYNSDLNYYYNISGESGDPYITVDDVHIQGTLGMPMSDDSIITFRLHNCTLAKSIANGSLDLSSGLLDISQGYDIPSMEKFGLVAVVERCMYGEDYFTLKVTGAPSARGSVDLLIMAFEDLTTAGVRLKSKRNLSAKLSVASPDTTPCASISTGTLNCKVGYQIDPDDAVIVASLSGGEDSDKYVEYELTGRIKKGQDVSNLFSGLPTGVKAYALVKGTETYLTELPVCLKGVPQNTATYNLKFHLEYSEYRQIFRDKTTNEISYSGKQMGELTSYTSYTINVTAGSEAAYAYDFSLDNHEVTTGVVSDLPYDGLKEAADSVPIILSGNIATEKTLRVDGNNITIGSKKVFSGTGKNFWLYIPSITFNSAYNADTVVDDIVRIRRVLPDGSKADCPVPGYRIFTETAITKGKQTGLSLLLYVELSELITDPIESFDGLVVEIKDGSTWKEVVMPTGSCYEVSEVVSGNVSVNTENYKGLSASVADCSINGIKGFNLWDKKGVEVTLEGAQFTGLHKGKDVTSWFKNLPSGVCAVIKEDCKAGSTTAKVRFGHVNKSTWKIATDTPTSAVRDAIRVEVAFDAIKGEKFDNIDGVVVGAVNENARFNIYDPEEFCYQNKIMFTATVFTGAVNNGIENSIGTGSSEECVVYIPGSLLNGMENPALAVSFVGEEGDFTEQTMINCTAGLKRFGNTNVYSCMLYLYRDMIFATRACEGELTVEMADIMNIVDDNPSGDGIRVEWMDTDLSYIIAPQGQSTAEDDSVEEENPGGNGSGSGSGSGSDSTQPAVTVKVGATEASDGVTDIWVGGKDNKKEKTYCKTLSKKLATLIPSVPSGSKIVVSVTDTDVTAYDSAFSAGKGQKSDKAKASYKAKDGAISVSAGKTEGTARVWAAAVDKKKEVVAYGWFDVDIATAPKKFIVSKAKAKESDELAALKSVSLSKGDSVSVVIGSDEELAEDLDFTWTATKSADSVKITPATDSYGASIAAVKAPAGGKVVKVPISVVNVQSGKKVTFSIMIGNEVESVEGLSSAIAVSSAAEDKVEKTLDYKFVCADSSAGTTDKIKAFVTSELEAGSGYDLSNNKFKLSAKASAASIAYKNGTFTLKVKKGTENGTQVRVLVVATHADRTVDVFEGGVITIG